MTDDYDDRDELDAELAGDDEEFDDDDYAVDGPDESEDEDRGSGNVRSSSLSPAEGLQELVHYLASNLVDRPEEVDVRAEQRGPNVQISLFVPEDELGKVIGRQGRIARAIRTVVMIAGSRHNVRASLDIEG